MSSDDQKKDKVIQSKKFYLEEEIYQQIINGFESAKQRQAVDKKNMPVILKVQQLIRLKLSSPYVFGGFFRADWFKGVFEKEYQDQKKKKMKDIRDKFYYAWYDLQWWFNKLEGDEQEFEAEKDKEKHHFNFWKAYKRISKISRWYKAIKVFVQSCKNSESLKALFGQSYNLLNEKDYRRFQNNLNWVVQDIQKLFIPSIMVLTQPMMKQVSYLYVKTLQQLYDRFCWWLIKTILIGTTWWEVAISIAGYAASIFTAGAAAGGMIAARIAAMSAKLINMFGKFFALGTRLIGSSSRFLRGVGQVSIMASKGFRAGGALMMRGAAKMNTWGKGVWQGAKSGKYKAATRAFMRRNPKKFKFSKMAISGGVALALFYFDDSHYERVYRYIRKRTAIMYKGVEQHLVNLRNTGEMIGDIGSFLDSVSDKAFQTFQNLDNKSKENDYRTNRLYDKKLKIKERQFRITPLFNSMRILSSRLEYIGKIVKDSLNYIKLPISKKTFDALGKKKDQNYRWVYSQGDGKFGIALYKNKKRLVFENIIFDGETFEKIVLTQVAKYKENGDKEQETVGVSFNDDTYEWKRFNFITGLGGGGKKSPQKFTWTFLPERGKQFGMKNGFELTLGDGYVISFKNTGSEFLSYYNNLPNLIRVRYFDKKGNNNGTGDIMLVGESWHNTLGQWYQIKSPIQSKKNTKTENQIQKHYDAICKKILLNVLEKLTQIDEKDERRRAQLQGEISEIFSQFGEMQFVTGRNKSETFVVDVFGYSNGDQVMINGVQYGDKQYIEYFHSNLDYTESVSAKTFMGPTAFTQLEYTGYNYFGHYRVSMSDLSPQALEYLRTASTDQLSRIRQDLNELKSDVILGDNVTYHNKKGSFYIDADKTIIRDINNVILRGKKQ